MKRFIRHFRIYFKNNHPAYIVDEDGGKYYFHRTTHSKTSGGKKNLRKDNPLDDGNKREMYIVRREEKDNKSKFSLFKLKTKKDIDISYPEIKRAGNTNSNTGSHQAKHDYFIGRSRYESSRNIKSKRKNKVNKKKGGK